MTDEGLSNLLGVLEELEPLHVSLMRLKTDWEDDHVAQLVSMMQVVFSVVRCSRSSCC